MGRKRIVGDEGGNVMSFYCGFPEARKINELAKRENKTNSFVIRKALKHFFNSGGR